MWEVNDNDINEPASPLHKYDLNLYHDEPQESCP